jgi:hypothetical protein
MLRSGAVHKLRQGHLSVSEMMTIMIPCHQSHYRHFKANSTKYVQVRWRSAFPQLVGDGGFVQLMPRVLVPLCAYLVRCYGHCTGVSFIGSTPIAVCHNRPIPSHRSWQAATPGGRVRVGWFFGFKLHLVVNDLGELLACWLTLGNVDNRSTVPRWCSGCLASYLVTGATSPKGCLRNCWSGIFGYSPSSREI